MSALLRYLIAVGKSFGRATRRVRLAFTSATWFDEGPLASSVGKRSGVCSSMCLRPMRIMLPRCRQQSNFDLVIRGDPSEQLPA
jgi:hypothetical protein